MAKRTQTPAPEPNVATPGKPGLPADPLASLIADYLLKGKEEIARVEVPDPEPPEHQGFDFGKKKVQQWEVAAIRRALDADELDIHPHTVNAFRDENIPISEIDGIIRNGKAASKDLPSNRNRVPGINFEHNISDGRKVRVKVTWDDGYMTVTGHTMAKGR